MNRIINVSVGGNYLKKDKKSAGVKGEANVTRLRITFDNGWDNYAKTVTFLDARGQNPVNVVLGVNLLEDVAKDKRVYIVPIPAEPMAISGELTFIIEGVLDNKIQKSFADRLEVKDAPDTTGAVNAVEPTPSELTQLQTEIEFIKDTFGKSSYVSEDGTVYVWSEESGEYVPLQAIKGEDGTDGKSAYELAKEGGYTGTEAEFIALLNGLTSSENGEHRKDFNNPHKVTAQQVGALPLTGGTLTNKTIYFDNGNARLSGGQDYMQMDVFDSPKDDNNRRKFVLNGNNTDLKNALVLTTRVNGEQKNYNIYGVHNKPTSYDVGAVSKNGDTMTGALVIKKPTSWGQVEMRSPLGYYRALESDDTRTRIDVRDDQLTTSRRFLDIYSNVGEANLKDALKLVQAHETNDNKTAIVMHTENINNYIISRGSYAGAGKTSKTLSIRNTTQMVIVYATSSSGDAWMFGVLIRGMTRAHCNLAAGGEYSTNLNVSWTDTSVTYGLGNADPKYSWDMTGATYHYVLIG